MPEEPSAVNAAATRALVCSVNTFEGGGEMGDGKNVQGLNRRDFLYLSGIGMAGLSLSGIPDLSEGAEKKPRYGGRLRVAHRFGSSGLDAHRNQDFMDYMNYCYMYSALTEQGGLPQVEIYPMLAKSWEISKDGREYIFPLREGVKFHHGKEFDSADVKYSIERVLNPATRAPRAFALRWIDSIQIIDKYHIKIRLKEPFAPFLASLTLNNCPIIPSGWEPTPIKPAPGTGPFVFKSFVPNETTEFTRFDQYWEVDEETGDRLPYADSLMFKKIVDENVRMTALRAGEVDVASSPPGNILIKGILEKPPPGIYMKYEMAGNNWIWFNCSKPPFDQKKVRQAVAYAVDKKQVLQGVFWGLGETINNQPFRNVSRFYIPVEDREVNLAKAKQLLAEAGYPNGFKTEFLQFSVHYDLAGCEVVIGQLKKIGIDATMKVVDRAAWVPAMRKGDYSISYRGGVSEVYDWDDAFYMYLDSDEIGKNNYSRYSNKEVDALLERGRKTMNMEERRSIYAKAVDIFKEDLPILYMIKITVGNALRDYVKGYRDGFGIRAFYRGGMKYYWLDK